MKLEPKNSNFIHSRWEAYHPLWLRFLHFLTGALWSSKHRELFYQFSSHLIIHKNIRKNTEPAKAKEPLPLWWIMLPIFRILPTPFADRRTAVHLMDSICIVLLPYKLEVDRAQARFPSCWKSGLQSVSCLFLCRSLESLYSRSLTLSYPLIGLSFYQP